MRALPRRLFALMGWLSRPGCSAGPARARWKDTPQQPQASLTCIAPQTSEGLDAPPNHRTQYRCFHSCCLSSLEAPHPLLPPPRADPPGGHACRDGAPAGLPGSPHGRRRRRSLSGWRGGARGSPAARRDSRGRWPGFLGLWARVALVRPAERGCAGASHKREARGGQSKRLSGAACLERGGVHGLGRIQQRAVEGGQPLLVAGLEQPVEERRPVAQLKGVGAAGPQGVAQPLVGRVALVACGEPAPWKKLSSRDRQPARQSVRLPQGGQPSEGAEAHRQRQACRLKPSTPAPGNLTPDLHHQAAGGGVVSPQHRRPAVVGPHTGADLRPAARVAGPEVSRMPGWMPCHAARGGGASCSFPTPLARHSAGARLPLMRAVWPPNPPHSPPPPLQPTSLKMPWEEAARSRRPSPSASTPPRRARSATGSGPPARESATPSLASTWSAWEWAKPVASMAAGARASYQQTKGQV